MYCVADNNLGRVRSMCMVGVLLLFWNVMRFHRVEEVRRRRLVGTGTMTVGVMVFVFMALVLGLVPKMFTILVLMVMFMAFVLLILLMVMLVVMVIVLALWVCALRNSAAMLVGKAMDIVLLVMRARALMSWKRSAGFFLVVNRLRRSPKVGSKR